MSALITLLSTWHPPHWVAVILAGIPDPGGAQAPPGSQRVLRLLRWLKWLAGVGLIGGFFAGLLVWAGGRWVDHHRAGRVGLVMMLAAVAGALFYGMGYQLIDSFSHA